MGAWTPWTPMAMPLRYKYIGNVGNKLFSKYSQYYWFHESRLWLYIIYGKSFTYEYAMYR